MHSRWPSSAAIAAATQNENVREGEDEMSEALDDSAESAEDDSTFKESAEEEAAGAKEEDVAIDTE